MKKIIVFFSLLGMSSVYAQKNITPSDAFTIQGKIKHELRFSLADLDSFKSQKLNDFVISNHLGEKKGTVTQVRGIPFKSILACMEIDSENPKVLSSFYFVLEATDGYKIVFSWNEIFNTETGNNLYILTEKGGRKLKDMEDRIVFASPTDLATGRRFLKGLSKIMVKSAD